MNERLRRSLINIVISNNNNNKTNTETRLIKNLNLEINGTGERKWIQNDIINQYGFNNNRSSLNSVCSLLNIASRQTLMIVVIILMFTILTFDYLIIHANAMASNPYVSGKQAIIVAEKKIEIFKIIH